MNENWKQIPDWPYEASDLGRIRHLRTGIVLRLGGKSRYQSVYLHRKAGEVWCEAVHCLVLLAFRGPPPDGHLGEHLDDVSRNNRLSNLKWSTPSENMKTAYRLSPERWTTTRRPKLPERLRHKTRSLSLSAQMWQTVSRRVADLDIGISKYVQRLISIDLARKLLSVPREAA